MRIGGIKPLFYKLLIISSVNSSRTPARARCKTVHNCCRAAGGRCQIKNITCKGAGVLCRNKNTSRTLARGRCKTVRSCCRGVGGVFIGFGDGWDCNLDRDDTGRLTGVWICKIFEGARYGRALAGRTSNYL